jgi:hypothetical protein
MPVPALVPRLWRNPFTLTLAEHSLSFPAQNLHDFVLNLMIDDAARSAFAADPTAVLADAGLSDVTPQDIQEVAPLVAEYAPDPSALQVSTPDSGSTADLGAFPADPLVAAPDLGSVEVPGGGHFAGSADASTYHGEEVQAGATATISADSTESTGSLPTSLDSAEGVLTAATGSIESALPSDSPLAIYSVSANGALAQAGDLATSLDSDVLDKAAPAAGTVASFVSNGGDMLANGIETGSGTLGGYLTNAGGQASAAVTGGGNTLGQHAEQISDGVSGEIAHPAIPAVPALPAVSALPTPADLPVHLPPHLDADLPHSLPHLPVANPLPTIEHVATTVTDAVSHSPVGDIAAALDHTSALPEIGDPGNELPLAH